MDARLEAGSHVVQAYYSVLNPSESPVAALRYAALAALHYARPLGRSVFGGSCGLKGNGMCFTAEVMRTFGWDWFTLAEDVEFHFALVQRGRRVDFAPETTVLADMPVSLAQAKSQNLRWEQGRLELLRTRALGLLLRGLRERSLLKVDVVLEQLVPPLSVPVALGTLAATLGVLTRQLRLARLAGLALACLAAHFLVALALVRAPARVYLAFGFAPRYILWKVALYGHSLASRPGRWIRTGRTGEPASPMR
jgi:cellulose synthase/poly-beta-1,6-N-acetylglucosamine synthase-like glycosyltransferase